MREASATPASRRESVRSWPTRSSSDAGLEARERQELADEVVEPLGLLLDPLERALELLRVLAREAGRGLEARERGTELV